MISIDECPSTWQKTIAPSLCLSQTSHRLAYHWDRPPVIKCRRLIYIHTYIRVHIYIYIYICKTKNVHIEEECWKSCFLCYHRRSSHTFPITSFWAQGNKAYCHMYVRITGIHTSGHGWPYAVCRSRWAARDVDLCAGSCTAFRIWLTPCQRSQIVRECFVNVRMTQIQSPCFFVIRWHAFCLQINCSF